MIPRARVVLIAANGVACALAALWATHALRDADAAVPAEKVAALDALPVRAPVTLADLEIKPIFHPKRKLEANVKAPPLDTPPPRLMGVVLQDGGAHGALLQDDAQGTRKLVFVGQPFGRWKLVSVTPRKATLTDGSQRIDIPLNFETRDANPAPPDAGKSP